MGKTSSVICRVIKIGMEGKGQYILIDCNNRVLCKIDATKKKVYKPNCEIKWDDKKKQECDDGNDNENENWEEIKWEFTSLLDDKTEDSAEKSSGNVDNQVGDWKLRIKQKQKDEYKNINIPSCKHTKSKESFYEEIDTHIKQLLYIINGTSQSQATTYQQLWEGAVEVVFEEIFVDEYIKTINEAENEIDPYLKSLIAPEENQKPQERFLKDIFDKLRAQYVEGRLAGEHGMKDGGIWNAGSTGIDGEVYKYYAEKQKGDTHE